MLFVILQEDKSGPTDEIRHRELEAHREYLRANAARVVLAGPMLVENGIDRLGSCTLVNARDRAEAENYANEDPFARAGLFAATRIIQVRQGHFNASAVPAGAE
jgi:uncharacterized protein